MHDSFYLPRVQSDYALQSLVSRRHHWIVAFPASVRAWVIHSRTRVSQGNWTALHKAAGVGHTATVVELLRLGARWDIRTKVRARRSTVPRLQIGAGCHVW